MIALVQSHRRAGNSSVALGLTMSAAQRAVSTGALLGGDQHCECSGIDGDLVKFSFCG